jgi:nucleotide-binding universal stress UspA family protein
LLVKCSLEVEIGCGNDDSVPAAACDAHFGAAKKLSTTRFTVIVGGVLLISKILVAYDGSKSAEKALTFGLDIAEKYSAPVTILNVIELPSLGTPEDPLALSVDTAGLIKDMRIAHQLMLSNALEKVSKLRFPVHVSTELREGYPADQIAAAAYEGKFSLIVLGHGGEGRLREILLGGTSDHVAHLSQSAVLIVK